MPTQERTYTAKVSKIGDVRWRGYLNTSAPKLAKRYPSIYEPVGINPPRAIRVLQIGRGNWHLEVEGTVRLHFVHKTDAQRYAEEWFISNAYNYKRKEA